MRIKVGSLFDGIGGAPLSAVLSGAEPVWASEIEKVPISITKRHFPNMKHYGDITQINGAEIEPVDIIVGGSPCQDLSVAGKRAGLEGARSGLFMDQVRIVKEMRNATRRETSDRSTELPRPRYMVWENVPGAFSSNKGEDFRAVLEEICQVCDPEVSIPRPAKNKWLSSGTILGEGYSVAWRVVDAQHWGVPQRRRRIYLVADFGGHTAPEILFEQESVSRDITEGGETGQRIAADAEGSAGAAGECGVICSALAQNQRGEVRNLKDKSGALQAQPGMNQQTFVLQGSMIGRADHNGPQGSGVNEDVSFTLNTVDRHAVCYDGSSVTSPTNAQNPKPGDPCHTLGTDSRNYVCYGISSYHSNSMKSSNPHSGVYVADTSKTIDQNGGNPACNQGGIAVVQPICFEPRSQDGVHRIHGDISPTLNTAQGGQRQPCVVSIDCRNLREAAVHGTCSTMKQRDYKDATDLVVEPVYSLDRACFNQGINAKYGMSIEENTAQTLVARGPSAVASPEQKYIVRRLTPLECERLQGYPDGWTALDHEDKAVSDTQRYKALGNSFAVPNALFVISRCVKQLQKEEVNERD